MQFFRDLEGLRDLAESWQPVSDDLYNYLNNSDTIQAIRVGIGGFFPKFCNFLCFRTFVLSFKFLDLKSKAIAFFPMTDTFSLWNL